MNNPFGSNIEDSDATMPMAQMRPAVIDTPPEPLKVDAVVGPRVRIVLEDNDNIPPTGQFFGHNGKGYILRSGEPADVPPEIINILNDAIYDAPIVDPQTQQIIGYRKRLRFPYSVVKAVA